MSPKPSEPVGPDGEAALDHLLEQVVRGFFVLTDGQGNLSKWSEPAEFLFGLSPDEALGQPMFGRLLSPPYGAEGEAWRRFLQEDVPPAGRSAATLNARHPEAGEFPLEAVFVPVKLDEGFDFSLFLEDLSFELPMDLMLLRMRQQHPVVIKALRQALAPEPLDWEGWRTAGTLVVFTPKVETPWIDEAMRVREEQRRLMEEEAQSRIQAYEAPGVQGSDVHDLDDAAAVVERLRWATERIEDLEERSRIAEGAAHEVAEARKRAEAAEQAAIEARAQLTEALTKADAEVIATSEAERLELNARLDRIERAAQEAAEAAAGHRIAADRERQRVGEAQRQALELGKRLEALERDLVATAEASRAAAAERARIEAEAAVKAATRDFAARMDAIARARGDSAALAAAEGRAEASRAELQVRLEALERHQRDEWNALREEVADLKVAAADAVELRSQLKQMQNAVVEATGLRSEVARTREEVEALRVSGAGPEVIEEIRRLEGTAGDVAALREELDGLREAAGAVEPLRGELRGVLERLGDLADRTADLSAEVEERRGRPEPVRDGADADAGVDVDALRADADQLRAQAAELREETERLRSELDELRAGDDRVRDDVEALRDEQEGIRALLDEARRERDESREQLNEALRQFEDAKTAAARQAAEQAARSLGGTESAIRSRLERTTDEFAGLRRDAEAIRQRLAELAGATNAAERRAEEAHDDARDAQRVAREAAERIDQVDRGASKVLSEVRAQKSAVEAVESIAQAAIEAADAGRADAAATKAAIERVIEDVAAAREEAGNAAKAAQVAREEAVSAAREAGEQAADRVRADVEQLRGELESSRREIEDRLGADPAEALEALRSEVGGRLDELTARMEGLSAPREDDEAAERLAALGEAIESLRDDVDGRAAAGEVAALQSELQSMREDRVEAAPAAELDSLRQELHTRLVALESRDIEAVVEARMGEMAAELMAARTETEAVRRSVDDLRHEMQSVREYAASAKAEGSSALQLASAVQTASAHADHRVEELRREVSDARRLVDELRGHADDVRRAAEAAKAAAERAASAEKGTSARFTEVWDELIKKSRSASGVGRTTAAEPAKPDVPARDPRPGFDDQDRPMAVIGLDGKFKELNPSFAKLIGYDEHEFTRAAWPSVHDRGIYKQQLAAFAEMVAGDRDSFEVQSTYMHGQGLMVPVLGRLELVRDDEGAPAHLVLVAEERQHA